MQEVFQNLPVSESTQRVAAVAGIVAFVGGSAAVWAFDPSTTHFLPVCPLYAMTGFACPGCGLTRAFHALFHGDAVTALDFNALLPIWVAVFGYLFVSLVLTAIRGRGLTWKWVSPGVLMGLLALLLIFGVVRNLPFYPFSILFP